MTINLSALQKQRRDTAANWTAEDPTLLAGEIGLESDTGYWKVGDGATAWTSLAYVSGLGAEIPVDRLADGAARQLLQTDAAGTGVEWTDNVDVPGTLDVTGAGTFDGNVTIAGDLTVNGTTTTINTQDLLVEDKNVVIGNVTTPSDVTADGGGITLKGTTDKTINWVDATDAWTLSEHVNIASGKEYRINGTKVLDATSLGSGVTSSSLTSVGTIGTGTWQGTTVATGYGGTGQTTYTDGELLIGKTDGTLAKATITAGTGISVTNGDGSISISSTGAGVSTISQGDTKAEVLDTGTDGRFVVTTENTERLRVDNAGRVGIGVTPSTIDSTAARGVLALDGGTSVAFWASVSGTPKATFQHDGTDAIFYNSVSGYLAFGTNNTERLRIASNGAITTSNDITLNAQADLRFADSDSSNWVAFQAPATVASNVTWTLPDADGTSGQVLSTDGAGALSWATAAGGATDKIEEGNTSAEVIDTGSDGRFVVTTEGTERLRVDSSGRLGVGTASPVAALDVNGQALFHGTTGTNRGAKIGAVTINNNSADGTVDFTQGLVFSNNSNNSGPWTQAAICSVGSSNFNGNLCFATDGDSSNNTSGLTERMRINDGGQVFIGTTTFGGEQGLSILPNYSFGAASLIFNRASTTSGSVPIYFQNGGNNVGWISYTNALVAYNTTSDHRVKENIAPLNGAIARLQQLNPCRFNFIADPDKTVDGFIAHEVQVIVPEAINGEKDAVDDDGNPIYQGIDKSKLVPLLTAALQEAVAKIESLEARLTAAGI